ncbi:MAG: endo-1,4-beta-xylanase [Prevotellaceae bacterium]|nr:endo-1,4-beta-xylanase [Candidatus Minthosoma caballi]
MKKINLLRTVLLAGSMIAANANAQLSSNPDKFLGNITTGYQVDTGNEKYYTLWNQITCENESKWGSIEGTNNSFNWGGSDNAYNYAKSHNFPFKFHALVWGAQYPSWLEKQTPEQRYKEIVQWMDAVKKHYPDLQLIDVVNEAITGHQPGTPYFIEALGGTGKTGYDWLIKAFELAYERWPNAILIYNDFNTFQWNTDQYIDLVKTLRNAGAPIDAYGCQSHDLTDCSFTNFKNSMTKLQSALKMPMYSTEYDINAADDNAQLQRYKEQIPYMWEQDYVAGVTLWGYIHGRTWVENSGIIKNGKDRPAMTWLREYMKSDAAKNAKSPFPGMKKEASVYVKPEALNIEKNKTSKITVRAKMRTKTIEKVELYAKNALVATMTEEPYIAEYTPETTGSVELKAVVTNTDGSTFERYSTVTVCNPRAPYKNTIAEIPGVIQAENFDSGADGIAFHDNNSKKEGDAASYRSDTGGIDIVNGGTGKAIGYCEVGEWMEYTVNVKEAGLYSYDISYSAPEEGAAISLALSKSGELTPLTDNKVVLAKTNSWSTYKTAHNRLSIPLEAGEQVIRLNIAGGSGTYVINIDKITFKKTEVNEDLQIALTSDTKKTMAGTPAVISANVPEGIDVQSVTFYVGGLLGKKITEAPFDYEYKPAAKGTYEIMAIATDSEGKESNIATFTLTATAKRSAYKNQVVDIPGIIQAENFDTGEEGLTYHDSDEKDEGASKYRTDNGGVDIVTGNGGYAIGYTATNEWLEYTVNVKEAGKYVCTSTVSAGGTGSRFSISKVVDGKATTLWAVTVPQTASNSWDTYKEVNSNTQRTLEEGPLTLRITITGANCNIDKIELKCVEPTAISEVVELTEVKYDVYTTTGVYAGQITGGSSLGRKIYSLTGQRGAFIIKNTVTGQSRLQMSVK